MKRPKPKFQKGDIVRIVDIPYLECPFGWVDDMDEYCGIETTIADVVWGYSHNTYGYRIRSDTSARKYTWCENCFVVEADLEESDESFDAILQIKP